MHTRDVVLGKVLLGLLLWTFYLPFVVQSGAGPERCAPDYVLIKFRPEKCPEALKLPIEKGLVWLCAQLSLPSEAKLREPQINHWLRDNLPRLNASPRADGLMLDRFLFLHLPPGMRVAETVKKLRNHPLVDYIEADGLGELCLIPNDQGLTNQYQHYLPAYDSQPAQNGLLDTPDAWDITTGSSNVTVAIIDSGIEENWELNGRLVRGYNVISNNFETGTDTYPFHGTIMATILGANANNPLPGRARMISRASALPVWTGNAG